jgi:AcrR family transcriptional regulator
MRVRTETGRRKIVDAAIEIFRDEGYERASMARIAARTGGSKATLYGYFPSKENLFAIAMGEAITQQGERALTLLDPSAPDVKATLLRFADAFLRVTTSDDALALTRAIIAEGAAQQELTAAIQCPRTFPTLPSEVSSASTNRASPPRICMDSSMPARCCRNYSAPNPILAARTLRARRYAHFSRPMQHEEAGAFGRIEAKPNW